MNQTSANSLKRTKIRPPRKIISNSEVDFNKSWEILSSAIRQIQSKNSSNLSFEELYRTSYNLVLRKFGKLLYKNVSESIQQYLIGHVKGVILAKKEDGEFLNEVNRQWHDHLLSMRMISDVLMYLDRVYSKENHLPLIYDVGLNLFQECIVKSNDREIGTKVTDIVINEIYKNRDNGKLIDKFLIKSIVYMFETLVTSETNEAENYYLEYFEPAFLESSKEFYDTISKEIVASQNGAAFITEIHQLIRSEEQRTIIYLPDTTLPKLVDLMNTILISSNIGMVLKFESEGLKSFITKENMTMLSSVFNLISRYDDEHLVLRLQLRDILLSSGEELLQKAKEDAIAAVNSDEKKKANTKENATITATKWVQNVVELKEKYQRILKESFYENKGLMRTIEDAVAELINSNNKVSEFLSLYIDDTIKKSYKNNNEEECESKLDKSISVFRYIRDKDLFEKYYKNHLAKRLLSAKVTSIDVERVMISKIKAEIGPSFTSNLEGMFRDIKISKDLQSEFKTAMVSASEGESIKKKTLIEVSVLTSTAWPLPLNKDLKIIYPDMMTRLQSEFEKFYLSKHNARTLHWAPNFGSVDLRMRFKKKLYEINMSTYAAVIVMLFDDTVVGHELTCGEIQKLTSIPRQELGRQLQSLAVAPRTRLLTKSPMSKDIQDSDIFTINRNFSSPSTKLKVFTVSLANKVENDTERSKTMEAVDVSRKHETDAAIVRIMKARKILKHNELLNETIKQLQHRFKPPPALIKQRIEALLEREYLARDEEDRTVYHYLA